MLCIYSFVFFFLTESHLLKKNCANPIYLICVAYKLLVVQFLYKTKVASINAHKIMVTVNGKSNRFNKNTFRMIVLSVIVMYNYHCS